MAKQQEIDTHSPVEDLTSSHRKPGSKYGASAAGVGGGSLLAIIAQNLDESNPLKKVLILAIPCSTAVISIAWAWACDAIRDYRFEKSSTKTVKNLRSSLEEPNLAPEQKEQLRRRLAYVYMMTSDNDIKRMERLATHDT